MEKEFWDFNEDENYSNITIQSREYKVLDTYGPIGAKKTAI